MSVTEARPADGGMIGSLLHLAVSDSTNTRLRRAISSYLVAGTAWRLGNNAWRTARVRVTYTVAIPGDDEIYPDIHAWLIDQLAPRQRRAVLARSSRTPASGMVEAVSDGRDRTPAQLHQFYDGSREQTIHLEGHRIKVAVERDEDVDPRDRHQGGWSRRPERIVFTAVGAAGRDAVLTFLAGVTRQRFDGARPPEVNIASRWGDWRRRRDLPARPASSVVLRAGQKEALIADLRRFLASEADYVRLGIPYHRGYLFHGPPGTGKTSIAKALASELGLDVYYIPLSDLDADASLLNLVGSVEPGSLLLLEDIDVLHAAKTRDDEKARVSLSGLLNALDGVTTPHGLITVMTTNDVSVLDDALVRAGRVDYPVEIGYLDDDQAARLTEILLGEEVELPPLDGRAVAPAALVEVMKRHLHDPAAALVAVKELFAA